MGFRFSITSVSWLVDYAHSRQPEDVPRLWKVFRLALQDNPLENREFLSAYDDAIAVRGVNVNLSMGLFWIRPNVFLNLDGTSRDYLKISAKSHRSADSYKETIHQVRDSHGRSFLELSLDAYKATQDTDTASPKQLPSGDNYWFVGAVWGGDQDKTALFVEKGVWVNGYTDGKYADLIKEMQVGEKIAIKSVGTQKKNLPFDASGKTISKMYIKARGTIVKNYDDGRTVEVEWEPEFRAERVVLLYLSEDGLAAKAGRRVPIQRTSRKVDSVRVLR